MHPIFSVRKTLLLAATLALTACGDVPSDAAFTSRGPENLLDVSSEVVTLGAASKSDLRDLAKWVERDRPTRAELNCTGDDKQCDEARKVLDLHGVPIALGNAGNASVTLVYERVLAHDCDNNLRLNKHNFYNTNYPSFGCSVSANIVQHVTDKQEFISPNLSDDPSAARAVNDIHRAYVPRAAVPAYSVEESVVGKAKSQ